MFPGTVDALQWHLQIGLTRTESGPCLFLGFRDLCFPTKSKQASAMKSWYKLLGIVVFTNVRICGTTKCYHVCLFSFMLPLIFFMETQRLCLFLATVPITCSIPTHSIIHPPTCNQLSTSIYRTFSILEQVLCIYGGRERYYRLSLPTGNITHLASKGVFTHDPRLWGNFN